MRPRARGWRACPPDRMDHANSYIATRLFFSRSQGRNGGRWREARLCVTIAPMDREEVIRRLRAHEAELRAMGVKRLSLFGSVARGEAGPDSDVDLAAEFDRSRPFGMFQFAALEGRLRDLVGRSVDLVGEPIRKERFRVRVERDRVLVF
jgi:predicted nucleotidyltransferase